MAKKSKDAEPQSEAITGSSDSAPETITSAPVTVETKAGAIRVVATRAGYYANVYRNRGAEFVIRAEADFSAAWMKRK